MKRFLIVALLIANSVWAYSQFSVYNILESQIGNIPGTEPNNLFTTYNQLNLQYRIKGWTVAVRFEGFYKDLEKENNYAQLSQYLLNYNKRGLEFKLGNFYSTLGKGLLLRGYEIKNSVFEDQIYRVKQGFYKDIRGVYAGYQEKYFAIKTLTGKVLNNQLPPFFDEKRLDEVRAGELRLFIKQQTLGAIYLENRNVAMDSKYLSFFLEGNIFNNISYYGEFAKRNKSEGAFFNLGNDDSYGLYVNLNYTSLGFGISLEYKDYHNFLIGSGLADPPTLVKEHSYRLLNRSTHVTELFDESGFQTEIFVALNNKNLITFNYSIALNQIGEDFQFQEYFLELNSDLSDLSNLKLFFDYSSEELKLEKNRYATGFNYSRLLNNNWLISSEFEFQHVRREIHFQPKYSNYYGALIFSKSTKFSTSFVLEFTNDKIVADLANSEKIESKRFYPGLNIQYKPNKHHTFQLFAGERRGGPACTSGICYEVLDFKGVELRYSTRF